MPIVNSKLARIELTDKQMTALCKWWINKSVQPPAVGVEETNVAQTIAVTTKRGTSFLRHGGEVTSLGSGGGA
jgi:hypothetical protein